MTSNQKWEQLSIKLNDDIVKALKNKMEFHYMMPIQIATIPHFVQNKDVAVEANTGSGKTLAFIIPILQKFLKAKKEIAQNSIFSLILAPTRELALQINQVFNQLLEYLELNVKALLVTGGQNKSKDIKRIQYSGCNLIVGTPGKLKELFTHNFEESEIFSLKNFEMLILDEADRLISSEYQDDIKYILSKLPKQRRTGLFSATLNHASIKELIKLGLRNPINIQLQTNQMSGNVPKSLENFYVQTSNRKEKITQLFQFLKEHQNKKIIVFFNTCASVNFYGSIIKDIKYFENVSNKYLISGQIKQKKRNKIFQQFSQVQEGILIATDVIARGIDFEDVHYIIQVDPPQNPAQFIHRIGRTARVGKKGTSITFIEECENTFLNYLQVKNISLSPYDMKQHQFSLTPEQINEDILDLILNDRQNVEKSKAAFVSFLRSYKEHELKYVFQFKNLDLGHVANSFYLLRLPRVKEILGKKIENFKGSNIDPETIPFKSENYKKQFKQKQEKNEFFKKKKEKEKKEFDDQIKELKHKKQKGKKAKHQREKAKKEHDIQDFQDFSTEQRLVKKLKTGKISIEQYNKQMAEIDQDNLNDINDDYIFSKKSKKVKK